MFGPNGAMEKSSVNQVDVLFLSKFVRLMVKVIVIANVSIYAQCQTFSDG